MQVQVTPEEFAEAIQREWPLQAEITMLRLANRKLSGQLQAEQATAPAEQPAAGTERGNA